MKKDYIGSTKTTLVYPDSLQDYLDKEVCLIFANPDSRSQTSGKLTRRRGKYFVGNYAASLGDSIHSGDMQTFIGWIERKTRTSSGRLI